MDTFNTLDTNKRLELFKASIQKVVLQIISTSLLTFLLVLPAQSQQTGTLEIYSTYGYMFGGNLRTYDGNLSIGDDDNFKIGLNYTLSPGMQLEVHWMHQGSDVRITQYGARFDSDEFFDLSTDYFQIGALRELKSGPVRPFGKFTVGTAVFTPQDRNYDDVWRFALTMGGGVKAFLSDRVGLRISGSMMMPVYFSGLSFFCGSGGCSTGVGTSSAILQGELSAGLIIALQQ